MAPESATAIVFAAAAGLALAAIRITNFRTRWVPARLPMTSKPEMSSTVLSQLCRCSRSA
jgi:hypothetical protein